MQKYVVQEKLEGKLKKLLRETKKTISDLKTKIESLVAELAATKDKLAQYKLTLDNDTFENTGKSRFFERRTSRVLY